jgi:hypothetical protein
MGRRVWEFVRLGCVEVVNNVEGPMNRIDGDSLELIYLIGGAYPEFMRAGRGQGRGL